MSSFQDKVVVITGGNSGIGLATAKAFAKAGAKVVISGRDEKSLAAASAAIGQGTLAVRADTAKLPDVANLFARVKEKHGRIDVLFINAGVAKFAPLEQTSEALFDENMDINFKGAFFSVQHALPLIKDGGSIIFTTSVVSHKGFPGTTVYSASKAALRSLARTLSAELVSRKIRVNAVAPGPIVTPIFARMGMNASAQQQMEEGLASSVPMKRMGQAEEIPGAVLFLASEEASYITGVELNIDGGLGML